jgi:hypothetical protein
MLGREVDEHGTVTVVGCRISCHVQTACSEGSLTGGSTFSRNASRIKSEIVRPSRSAATAAFN